VEGSRFWASSEFLLWWTKGVPVNTPLITRGLNPFGPDSGELGAANTAVLLGGQSYDSSTRYGGRFTIGGWLNADHTLGLEGNYLFIAPRSIVHSVSSNGSANSPTLAFPFFDPTTGMESSVAFAVPGLFSGSSFLRLTNRLQSGELNLLGELVRTNNLNLTGLVGFRYVNFTESLDFQQGNVGIPGGGADGQIFTAFDTFRTTNNFYGGQLGLRGSYRLGNFSFEGTGKIALGSMNQAVTINGVTSAVFPDGFTLANVTGGTFAQGTNIGNHTRSVFCAVPEGDVKIGYNITHALQCYVGYSFLYLSDVARPGTAIDHRINTTQAPFQGGAAGALVGPPLPAFSFHRSDFWAQGINFGLQFSF
jgi:hypothetical protein